MVIKDSLIPREMPGNLGSRKHLILIKTEGSGREEQTILSAEGRQMCVHMVRRERSKLQLGESLYRKDDK